MYSLAGTLFHSLTGHTPFEAPEIDDVVLAHMNKPLTPPHKLVPSITGPTSDAIVRAMDKSPVNRYQSYDEFIMALTAARSQLLRTQFAPTALIQAAPRQARRRRRGGRSRPELVSAGQIAEEPQLDAKHPQSKR